MHQDSREWVWNAECEQGPGHCLAWNPSSIPYRLWRVCHLNLQSAVSSLYAEEDECSHLTSWVSRLNETMSQMPKCSLLILLINEGYGEAEGTDSRGCVWAYKNEKGSTLKHWAFWAEVLMGFSCPATGPRNYIQTMYVHKCIWGLGMGESPCILSGSPMGHRPNLRSPRSSHFFSPLCTV